IFHNARSLFKIYYAPIEDHKKDLEGGRFQKGASLIPYTVTPIGFFPLSEQKDWPALLRKYKLPVIDPSMFGYRDPKTLQQVKKIDHNALGFCYEYGLRVKKDLKQAAYHYRKAFENDKIPLFIAQINLSRMDWINGHREASMK